MDDLLDSRSSATVSSVFYPGGVEKVNPDLVVRGEDGKVTTVGYEAVNAMLLNESLKEHGQVQELKGTVAQQQKQIEALAATVQKVSDQVALSKPAPQLVANP